MSHPYVIIDGIRVPIVAGGSDEGDAPVADVDPAQAASDRLEAAFADLPDDYVDPDLADDDEGTPSAPEEPEVEEPAGDEPAGDEDQPISLKEARKLRQEQKQYRERWGAYEQAYGSVTPESVNGLLQVAPNTAADLALMTASFGSLVPQDQAVVIDVLGRIESDPSTAARQIAVIGALLRGEDPQAAGAAVDDAIDDLDDDDLDDDGPGYLTPEDLDERLGQWFTQRQREMVEAAEDRALRAELEELGYDLDSEDLDEQVRLESLLATARRLGGDLTEAHRRLESVAQARIDKFVEERKADAGRPLPPSAGAPASGERELVTMDDAEASMRARLSGAL